MVERDLVYEDGVLTRIRTEKFKLDKTSIFRELEFLAIEQERALDDMRYAKERYDKAIEEEAEMKEALAKLEKLEEESILEESNSVLEEIDKILE